MSTIINPNINKNNFYCFLSCVLSRLAYCRMPGVYQRYIMIMNFIPKDLLNSIIRLNDSTMHTIFDEQYDIDLIKLNLPQKINHIIDQPIKNLQLIKDKNVKIIELTSSNSNQIYIIADKRINIIFVIFRGTDDFKGATSWLELQKDVSLYPCNNSKFGFLLGVFNLEIELIHTIFNSIYYLSNTFLTSTITKPAKILTTGHSLGGGLCAIFAYLWSGIRYLNTHKLLSKMCNNIICVSVASPRVFNEYMVHNDLYKLIENNKIIYKRIVSIGDAFTTQPLFLSHPINKDSALFCTNTNNLNTDTINYKRPLICSSVEPTNILFSTLPHKNYMYVKFGSNTLSSLLFKEYEVKNDAKENIVIKIFVTFTDTKTNNNEYNLVFFYLNDIHKSKSLSIISKIMNFFKFNEDVTEDLLMNYKLFNNMIENTRPFYEVVETILYNIENNVRETSNNLVSRGRPIFNIKKALIDLKVEGELSPQFKCDTSLNINKIIKTKKRENKHTKIKTKTTRIKY